MTVQTPATSLTAIPTEALRLRRLSLRIGALFVAVVGLVLWSLRMPVELDGAYLPLMLLGTLLGGGLVTARRDPASRIGIAATGAALMLGCSLLGAALSMLVLRWGMPQADGLLRSLDAQIGISAPNVIETMSAAPSLTAILHRLYGTSIPLLILTVIVLGLSGRTALMWRACVMFAGSLLSICLASGLVPAKGAFLFVSSGAIERLPPNSGTYAFRTFDQFTLAPPESLSLAALNGVACFPSFHTAAALILCQCGWSRAKFRPFLAVWGGLVIFSTVPIGGHYVVDLLAGAGVFAVWSWLVRPRDEFVADPDGLDATTLGDFARA